MDGIYILIGAYLLIGLLVGGLLLVEYILQGAALSALRKGRELHPCGRQRQDAWMAWVPFARSWLLGDVADDVSRFLGKRSSWRIWMTVLSVLQGLSSLGTLILILSDTFYLTSYVSSAMLSAQGLGMALSALLANLLSIGAVVCRTLVLYRILQDYEPRNAVLYTVLSFLFSFCAPVFLFIIRKKPASTLYWAGQGVYPQGGGGFPV